MQEFFAGIFLGFLLGALFNSAMMVVSPIYLPNAQSNYTRCISDGGTQPHCVEKYLLPEKEPKP